MSRRQQYRDDFSGEADRGLREILTDGSDQESGKMRMRRIMLNVINNELTPRQKEIIMLYYFKDMDIVRIAEMTGVTPQAVSAVMKRARLKMYRYIQYYKF